MTESEWDELDTLYDRGSGRSWNESNRMSALIRQAASEIRDADNIINAHRGWIVEATNIAAAYDISDRNLAGMSDSELTNFMNGRKSALDLLKSRQEQLAHYSRVVSNKWRLERVLS